MTKDQIDKIIATMTAHIEEEAIKIYGAALTETTILSLAHTAMGLTIRDMDFRFDGTIRDVLIPDEHNIYIKMKIGDEFFDIHMENSGDDPVSKLLKEREGHKGFRRGYG